MANTMRSTDSSSRVLVAVNTLIRSQDGVVTHLQLVELGMSERTVRNRAVRGGPWQRILPGTYLTQTGPPSQRQLSRAALLYATQGTGRDAVLTGGAALELFGLRRLPPRDRVHVLVAVDNKYATTGHVMLERTARMPARIVRDGLDCAPFVRALVDSARRATDIDEARAVMAEAVQRRFCTPRQILDEIRDGPTRRAKLARQVGLEMADGVRSPAEGWFREALARFGVPSPRWNAVLRDVVTGAVVAVPDALWPGCCVIVEVDSREYHLSPEEWRRTQERHAMLTALGFVVLHVAPARIKQDPEMVCAEVMAALTSNMGRPWPRSVLLTRAGDTGYREVRQSL